MDISTETRHHHGIFKSLAAAFLSCSPKSTYPSRTQHICIGAQGEGEGFCWADYLPSCLFIELFLKLSQSFAKPFLICSCFSEMFKQDRPVKQRQEYETLAFGSILNAAALGNKQPAAMGHGRCCSQCRKAFHCITPNCRYNCTNMGD